MIALDRVLVRAWVTNGGGIEDINLDASSRLSALPDPIDERQHCLRGATVLTSPGPSRQEELLRGLVAPGPDVLRDRRASIVSEFECHDQVAMARRGPDEFEDNRRELIRP